MMRLQGVFQIVAILSYLWAVGTPPTADAPVGVPTKTGDNLKCTLFTLYSLRK